MDEIIAHIVEPYDYIQLILTIVTIILSVVSIIYTSLSFKMQKEFNRKSVCPIIETRIFNYSDHLTISLCNNGLGPAIIDKLLFQKNEVEKFSLIDFVEDDSPKIGLILSQLFCFKEPTVILPEKSIVLFSVHIDNYRDKTSKFKNDIEYVRKLFAGVNVKIQYKDLYDNTIEYCKKIEFEVKK